jgi:heme-degrading monooxygenase HmoA
MIMTVVEAHVAEEHWATLQEVYATRSQTLLPGIVQTYLVHSWSEPTLWQIMTVWESREALIALRQAGQPHAGDLMFQAAGAEPSHDIFEIANQATPG